MQDLVPFLRAIGGLRSMDGVASAKTASGEHSWTHSGIERVVLLEYICSGTDSVGHVVVLGGSTKESGVLRGTSKVGLEAIGGLEVEHMSRAGMGAISGVPKISGMASQLLLGDAEK